MKLQYLITGTGRSGSVFMARLLTSLGIVCGHECIFDWKGLHGAEKRLSGSEEIATSYTSTMKYDQGKWIPLEKWFSAQNLLAEASYLAAPFLNHDVLKDTKIIHVIRNPVKVVQSFVNYIGYFKDSVATNHYEEFIYQHVPELKENMPAYDRACLFWVRWNQLVDQVNPDFIYKVENDPKLLLDYLGKNQPYFSDTSINSYKKTNCDQFAVHKINSKLIYREFVAQGKKYGYLLGSEYLMI